ncbi:predicted protein [Histoplasma mississippiense (nom. inval.)]|uniref:predicted protein n=1 Tax=Ajellomyces capsulatus (strain NAm1 / WU24) TaxID=2059318 RepID=UPI000157D07C|nr:predicted protein [Histoplasma mississippiense (nom. inval.)]EDN11037.1 predicted protein [Histoplasma mississippiense (nom. inval.)]
MTSLADCTEVERQLQISKDLFSYGEKALALALQNRPKNTNKQYLPKQREGRDFCKETGFEDGEMVTERKLVWFLEEKVLCRPLQGSVYKSKRARTDRDGNTVLQTVGKSTVKLYVAAVVDLYRFQKSRGINSSDHPRGQLVSAVLRTHETKESVRKRAQYVDRGANTLQDGYNEKMMIHLMKFCWTGWYKNDQTSVMSHLRTGLNFLMNHNMLLRGETSRTAQLPDLFTLQLSNEGPTPCWPMILITDNGKTNQLGRLDSYEQWQGLNHRLRATTFFLEPPSPPPPKQLEAAIWPWVDVWLDRFDSYERLSQKQRQTQRREREAAEMEEVKETEQELPEDEQDLAAQGFLRLLKQLRTVILQDSVLLQRQFPDHPLWSDALFVREDYQKYTLQIVQALETAVEPQEIQIQRVVPVITDQLKNVRQEMIQSIDKWGYENQQLQQKMAQQLADLVDGQITFSIRAVPQSSAAQNSVMNLAAIPSAFSLPSSSSTLSRDIVQRSVESEMEMRQSSSNNAESVDLTATLLTSSWTGNGYSLSRTIQSVPDLWREWTTGLGGGPSVQSLEDQGGSWRKSSSKEQMMFCRRKIIINEIRFLLYSVFSHYSWLSYEDNRGWALSLLGLSGPQGPHRILFVADQQLSPFTRSPQSRAVLGLPGQDVPSVRGSMTELQVRSHRPSYINAFLIQSRGRTEPHACLACRSAHPGLRPFPQNAVACLATLVELVATANGVIMPFAAPYEMGKGWR